MFAYNPTVDDMSGQILGQGAVNAANTRAQAQVQMVDSIGNSIVSLAAAYGAKKGTEAKGKNFKKFMGMAGDTFGMDSAMFADMDDYDAGMMLDNFGSWMPAMANAQLGQNRLTQQQLAPIAAADIKHDAIVTGQGGESLIGAKRRFGAMGGN